MKQIKLNKNPFLGSKFSSIKSTFLTDKQIKNLVNLSYEEILKYLEEHGFKHSIIQNYLEYTGFYLIETILNEHLSTIYTKLIHNQSQNLKFFFETYYFKYQIHNFMVLLRTFKTKDENIETYLIGEERKKEKFIKSSKMPNINDAITYICKKLKLDNNKIIEIYKNGDLFQLENYLYKEYYQNLKKLNLKYNNIIEKKFMRQISNHIDLINIRTYLLIKEQNNIDLKNNFLEGGKISLNEIKNVSSKYSYKEIDQEVQKSKQDLSQILKTEVSYSPFSILKILLEKEIQINQIRIILKGKYLNLEKEEILNLIK